ncbi:MAG TPA: hypothetical protein VFH51_18910, partial [Myxococcota bacterium]|nr:hypothetical protein [Myxococcota bacterium]
MDGRARGTLVVLAVTGVLRLPAFAWPAISDDEAIYDAMAHTINAGGVMYRDAVDHKPPGLAYTYALVERWRPPGLSEMEAVHALGLALALLTAYGLIVVARQLGADRVAPLAGLLYGVASAAKVPYDGLAVNGELLMNAPAVWAVWAVLRGGRAGGGQRLAWDLAAGALVGLAGLAKWQALVTGLPFPFFAAFALRPGAGASLGAL